MNHKFRHYVKEGKSKWKLIEAKRVIKTVESTWYTPSVPEETRRDERQELYDFNDENS